MSVYIPNDFSQLLNRGIVSISDLRALPEYDSFQVTRPYPADSFNPSSMQKKKTDYKAWGLLALAAFGGLYTAALIKGGAPARALGKLSESAKYLNLSPLLKKGWGYAVKAFNFCKDKIGSLFNKP